MMVMVMLMLMWLQTVTVEVECFMMGWGGFGCKGDSLEGLVTRFIREGQGPT